MELQHAALAQDGPVPSTQQSWLDELQSPARTTLLMVARTAKPTIIVATRTARIGTCKRGDFIVGT
jgi:hypothetical protein